MEEAAAEQETVTEGTTEVPNGTGTEGTEDIRGKTPAEESNWERLVDIVHTSFGEGHLAEENMWQAVVMIPKGEKEYCGIGLVEVMWKVVAEILNLRLTASITFYEFLHGFWVGRGTGTANL